MIPTSYFAAHPLQPQWDLALGAMASDVLRVALEHDLFGHLRVEQTAAQLATRLGWDAQRSGYLLGVLWSMHLLERASPAGGADRFLSSRIATDFLAQEAPFSCASAWLFRLKSLRQAGATLEQMLQPQLPPLPPSSPLAWAAAARDQIAEEQRAVTCPLALQVIGQVGDAVQQGTFLDLGGGPGLVAVSLAARYPALRGVVFDFPATAAVAAENIRHAGLGDRLSAKGGDLSHDDIGSGYQMIWCSSVLHFAADIPATLRKLHAALRPGGTLICAHASLPATANDDARRILSYYLSMRLQGRHVLSSGELESLLVEAGFVLSAVPQTLPYPMAPVTLFIVRRRPDGEA